MTYREAFLYQDTAPEFVCLLSVITCFLFLYLHVLIFKSILHSREMLLTL